MGRGAKLPPQLGQTLPRSSAHVAQKVQSKLQSTRLGRIVLGDKNAVDGFAGRKGKGLVDSLYGEKGMFGSRLSKAHPVPNKTMDAVDLDATLNKEARRAIGKKILDETAKGAIGAPIGELRDPEKRGRAILDVSGKVIGYAKDGKKAAGYDDRGLEQPDEETRKDLDF